MWSEDDVKEWIKLYESKKMMIESYSDSLTSFRRPIRTSVESVRSCASSRIMQLYLKKMWRRGEEKGILEWTHDDCCTIPRAQIPHLSFYRSKFVGTKTTLFELFKWSGIIPIIPTNLKMQSSKCRQFTHFLRVGSCIASLRSIPSVMNFRIVDSDVMSSNLIKYPTFKESMRKE